MKNWSVILLIALLALCGECLAESAEDRRKKQSVQREKVVRLLQSANDQWVTKLVGAESNRATIAAPAEVRVYALKPQGNGPTPNSARDYPVSKGPIKLSSDEAKAVSQLLLGVNSYRWAFQKSCLVNYGARLEFVGASNTVDVLVCLECDVLSYQPGGRSEDFAPIRGKLVNKVFKALGLSDNDAEVKDSLIAPDANRLAAVADFTDRKKLLWYSESTNP